MNAALRSIRAGHTSTDALVRATVIVVAVALGLLVPLGLLGYAASALFLVFGGILFAVFLRMLASRIAALLPVLERAALPIAVIVLLALAGLAALWTAPRLSDQLGQLTDQLPSSLDHLRHAVEGHPFGQWLLSTSRSASSDGQQAFKLGERLVAYLFEGVGSLVIVLFLGLYFAADPQRYLDGSVRLLPMERRPPVREALIEAGRTLERWLFGRLLAMAFVGVTTGAALAVMGIPLAFLLGLSAGLLGFIPYIGPLVSGVPAVLLALEQHGVQTAAGIVVLYLGIQTVQDYLLTPVIQQYTVSLPPVLTITSQIFAGIWVGPIGVTLATPLTVVLMVLVRRLYIEAYLGDRGRDERSTGDRPVAALPARGHPGGTAQVKP
jgi:predicted PurR-regulated permease PerM